MEHDDMHYKTNITSIPVCINEHVIYLYGEITSPEDYTNVFGVLEEAMDDDVITLKISSPGGDLNTALEMYGAIKNCKANVKGVINSDCSSAASMIFLACDEWDVGPFAQMLVHEVSYGVYGKHSDNYDATLSYQSHFKNIISSVYKGFLSERDLLDVSRGKQLYLTADEITCRLVAMLESTLERLKQQEGGSNDKCENGNIQNDS